MSGLLLRVASPADASACAALIDAAGRRFRETRYPEIADHAEDADRLAAAAAAGSLHVARLDGALVGVLELAFEPGVVHVVEMDVAPAAQGTGVGAALLDHAEALGRAAGASRVTLTTFRDVPWNAPYYARRGFREVAPEDASQAARAELAHMARQGFGSAHRVAMARAIGPG